MKTIVLSILMVMLQVCMLSGQDIKKNSNMTTKKINHVYTVFITNKLSETVNFYEHYFRFSKVFESTFFVLLQSSGEQNFYLAFMDETHPTTPRLQRPSVVTDLFSP